MQEIGEILYYLFRVGTEKRVSVRSISPETVYTGQTAFVTITGKGFDTIASVTLKGGKGPRPEVSDIVVVDAGTITANIRAKGGGPHQPTTWNIRVTNLDRGTGEDRGNGVLKRSFTVIPL